MKRRIEKNHNLTLLYQPIDLCPENDSERQAVSKPMLNQTNIKIKSSPSFTMKPNSINPSRLSKKSLMRKRKQTEKKEICNKRSLSNIPELFNSQLNPEKISNFKTAYKRLIELFTKNNKVISKGILPSEISSNTVSNENQNLFEKLQKYHKELKEKMKKSRMMKEEEIMKECTFHPDTARRSRRNLSFFLYEQKAFLDRKNEILFQKRKDSKNKSLSFISEKPLISSKSSRLAERKKETIVERNPKIEKAKLENSTTDSQLKTKSTCLSHQINPILSTGTFDVRLYHDALERQAKASDFKQIQEHPENSQKENSKIKRIKLVEKKLEKEYEKIYRELFLNNAIIITIEQMNYILYKLGFTIDPKENINELWDILKIKENHKSALLLILKSIMKISPDENKKEKEYIHKKFYSLYLNKISHAMKNITGVNININQFSFKPSIDETSSKIAHVSIERIFNEVSKNYVNTNPKSNLKNSYDINNAWAKLREAKIQKNLDTKNYIIFQDCTFQPKTILTNEHKVTQRNKPLHEPKTQVYKYSQSKENMDYQKNKKECTFKPCCDKSQSTFRSNKRKIVPSKIIENSNNCTNCKNSKEEKTTLIKELYQGDDSNLTNNKLFQNSLPANGNQNRNNDAKESQQSLHYQTLGNSPKLSDKEKLKIHEEADKKEMDKCAQDNSNNDEEDAQLLVDINLGEGNKDKIILMEGDSPSKAASLFAIKHG